VTQRWRGWAGALLLVSSCSGGQSGAEDENSGSESECTEQLCAQAVLSDVLLLSEPRPRDVEYVAASCSFSTAITGTALGTVSGSACNCQQAELGAVRAVGPVGLGCYVLGRGGDCLWGDGEFQGCDVNAPSACEDVCAELELRQEADAARSFQAELVYSACGQGEQDDCQSVVSIDGRCYANRDYDAAHGYDCALGASAILEQHAADTALPQQTLIPDGTSSYLPGTNGMLQLTTATEYWGTSAGPTGFGVYAQFFDVEGESGQFGEVLDPLDGVDDCGVIRSSFTGVGPRLRLLSVAQATFHDQGQQYSLEEFRSSSDSYYSYLFDLSAAGVVPRPGGRYGFSASGGSFAANIELVDIELPEALSFPDLASTTHLDRGAIGLTWTGRGAAPLRLSLQIEPKLGDFSDPYTVECLMADDGAFNIPASVLESAPDGVATALFRREQREVVRSGGKSIQTISGHWVTHRFWLGPVCDGSAVMAACQRSAAEIRARYAECSDVPPPSLGSLCPDYLTQSCNGCREYFECRGDATRCESGGLTSVSGCACP
jgi:hypothetical protein